MGDAERLQEQMERLSRLLQAILEEREHEVDVLNGALAESRRRAEENQRRISALEDEMRGLMVADLSQPRREVREVQEWANYRRGELILFAVLLYLPVFIYVYFRLF